MEQESYGRPNLVIFFNRMDFFQCTTLRSSLLHAVLAEFNVGINSAAIIAWQLTTIRPGIISLSLFQADTDTALAVHVVRLTASVLYYTLSGQCYVASPHRPIGWCMHAKFVRCAQERLKQAFLWGLHSGINRACNISQLIGMWPRSRHLGLEAASRRLPTPRLGLASASGFNASVSIGLGLGSQGLGNNF